MCLNYRYLVKKEVKWLEKHCGMLKLADNHVNCNKYLLLEYHRWSGKLNVPDKYCGNFFLSGAGRGALKRATCLKLGAPAGC
jgi:hypothetical protein